MNEDVIKPGMNVDCAIELDDRNESLEIRKGLVYDVTAKNIILSQTTPAMLSSTTGKRIAVTYIRKTDNTRIGVSAKVDKIIKHYKLSHDRTVPAVILSYSSQVRKYNLRFAFRVSPPKNYNIKLALANDDVVDIIDISASGVRFAHKRLGKFDIDQEITMTLSLNDKLYTIRGRVVRRDQDISITLKKIEYVAVQFLELEESVSDDLVRAVREIERKIAYKQLFS